MVDYDFSSLNDKEFENFSIELISKFKNKRFERFKPGKDGGIDGRYYNNGNSEIIQCKHYLKTGWSGLISSLKKENDNGINEIKKVHILSPDKYIFITSLPLSPDNKKEIKTLFNPFIKADDDIYGQEDLNVLLSNFPEIEKRYYKLWLTSSIVLEKLINSSIENRSDFLEEDIKEKSKYYVITDNHNEAIEKIEKSNVIIIAGEPGIGKTTLAEHIALQYINKDFKFYSISNDMKEAFSVMKKDEKQVFYFDDFLGANYLKAIENKNDTEITNFINIVKRNSNKKFILTSRTNIINRGMMLSDTFRSKNLINNEFILEIEKLSDFDKAMILYNHIWYSELSEKYIEKLYEKKRYRTIINHKNFNPRLIEFITDINKIEYENIKPEFYWEYIVDKLNNPQDIWQNTFDIQSDDFVRATVILTVFNGNNIAEDQLIRAYNDYIKLLGIYNSSNETKQFENVIRVAVKYFLNRNILVKNLPERNVPEKSEYNLFNPSIADYVINKYKNEIEIIKIVISVLKSVSSLKALKELLKNKYITNKEYSHIIEYSFEESYSLKDFDFLIELSHIVLSNSFIKIDNFDAKLKNVLNYIITFKIVHIKSLKLINYSIQNAQYTLDLKTLIEDTDIYELDMFVEIAKIYNNLGLNDNTLIVFLENLDFCLIDAIYDDLKQLAYSEIEIYSFSSFDPQTGEEDFNSDSLNDEIENLLEGIFPEEYMNLYNIQKSEVLELIDVSDLDYNGQDNYDDDRVSNNINIDDIDDLFSR